MNILNRHLFQKVKYRWFSTINGRDIQIYKKAKEWMENLSPATIPLDTFQVRFDRSSGPGGQKVNKTSSKCTMTLRNLRDCQLIPFEIKKLIIEKPLRHYKKTTDSIVIQSDTFRSREKNKQLCLNKLIEEIKNVCSFPSETAPSTLKNGMKSKGVVTKEGYDKRN
ncbi:Pth4p NDAI_0G04040 [Naumovozyma dairenensis CBS 421]|uniref:Prokaryotic-type class I peptide chain release factors domain-containing protein n=1 Tax=Naumovozyma dairenensis (strain ATCC 10597 / BCRC 20456 / CBS 421 / NBRC 0211 / NRRL Y-12639) TaxID=1071378 RepID=G0WEH0_NAUDC|nr:hypothetical protein NDAI_0G04040 [Naumovozyma dairenensis CBS 421]CCD26181.2 hypothetical protein NDAI_0G04040 [Naumovozyma dairenensis CBS 421]